MDLHAVIGLLLKTLEVLAEVSAVGSFAIDMAALNQGRRRGTVARTGGTGGDEGGKAPENEKAGLPPASPRRPPSLRMRVAAAFHFTAAILPQPGLPLGPAFFLHPLNGKRVARGTGDEPKLPLSGICGMRTTGRLPAETVHRRR
jgi:hypothetical protein